MNTKKRIKVYPEGRNLDGCRCEKCRDLAADKAKRISKERGYIPPPPEKFRRLR